jgi:phenylacetate-coenzyme A ligase PaaK-like adenylate-forming protein
LNTFAKLTEHSLEYRREFTHAQLTRILSKASKTLYGTSVGGSLSIKEWPFLEKEVLRRKPLSLLAYSSWRTSSASTGGTTGVPVVLYRSLISVAVEQASIDGLLKKVKIHPTKARIAVLRGDTIKDPSDTEPPYWKPQGPKRLLFSSHHLKSETIEAYVNELRAFNPNVLMAYPSAVEALSALMIDKGLSLHIPATLTSSEVLTPKARKLIHRGLNCQIVDHYGQAERVAFAAEIDGGGYYFLPGYAYIELIYSSSEAENDLYEVIGTPLWNKAMPLVRYRTGDFIRLQKNLSAKELDKVRYGVTAFLGIEGRRDDYLVSPDGVRAIGMNHIPRGVKNIIQMQLIQESRKRVRILVVPTSQFSETDSATILANAYSKLPHDMHVTVEPVDQLKRTAIGKAPFIIREPDIE